MPDDPVNPVNDSAASAESLTEQDIAEAEASVITEASSTDFSCKMTGCAEVAEQICPKCKHPYCPKHASEVDPDFCFTCCTPADIITEKKPLVDEDGVTHLGASIAPSGPAFKTLMQRIADMTDETLRAHIRMWQEKVKEAERVLDYRRIALGACQLELEEKEAIARRKLKGVRVTTSGQRIAVSASGASGSQDPKAKALAQAMKVMGITDPAKATEFLKKLAEFAKAQTAAAKPNGGTK